MARPSFAHPYRSAPSARIVLNGPPDLQALRAIESTLPRSVHLRGEDCFDLTSLLKGGDRIEHLYVGTEIENWSVLSQLPRLERLEIAGWFDSCPDLAELEKLVALETYANEGHEEMLGRGSPSLVKLQVLGNRLPLTGWGPFPKLRSLTLLGRSHLTDLEGLENFSELTDLALNGMEKLSDFSALVACENLQVLSINACRKIESYSSLSQLGALEKLRILDSAPIASLALFRELEKLNELIFTGTKIRDGEFGHLLKMPNLKECWFRNQRDAEVTCELVRKTLEQRHGPSAALPRRIGPGESVPYALGTDLPPLVDPRGEPIAYREPPPI